jgi:leucyl-tRNA synthetase
MTTYDNIEVFRRQLRRMGLGHDDRRSIVTTDPSYYRWTQWIFLQIFNSWYDAAAQRARPISELIEELDAGTREPGDGGVWAELDPVERRVVVDNHRLVYRAESTVNWCPGLGGPGQRGGHLRGRSERGTSPFSASLVQWICASPHTPTG